MQLFAVCRKVAVVDATYFSDAPIGATRQVPFPAAAPPIFTVELAFTATNTTKNIHHFLIHLEKIRSSLVNQPGIMP